MGWAKATTGSYINPTPTFGESRGARLCGVMNYEHVYSDDTCQPKHDCTVCVYCAAPLLIIAFKQNAAVREHLLFL